MTGASKTFRYRYLPYRTKLAGASVALIHFKVTKIAVHIDAAYAMRNHVIPWFERQIAWLPLSLVQYRSRSSVFDCLGRLLFAESRHRHEDESSEACGNILPFDMSGLMI